MRSKVYLDTNILLRLVVQDNDDQYQSVLDLLDRASQGQILLFVSNVVLSESEWVLRSVYKISSSDIRNIVRHLLDLSELEFQDRAVWYQALEYGEENALGWEDNYHLAYALINNYELATFDKNLKKRYNKSI